MKYFRKITEPAWIIASSTLTFITSLITTILDALASATVTFYVFLGIFLVGISTTLTQIIVSTYLTNEYIKNTGLKKSGILLPSLAAGVSKDLEVLVNTRYGEIKRIKIICYGTSAYGDFIRNMMRGVYPGSDKIQLEVMFCAPDAVYLGSDRDKKKIEDLLADLKGYSNISVYFAKFIPTIRGCIVYSNNDKAIWNCLQFYSYSNSTFSSAEYTYFYALVGTEENDLLGSNESIINKEFSRLKK